MMTSVDFGVIALYALLMVWIGLVARRRSGNVDQYFAAGHRLPWWMAAISHHVSGYSAVAFVGFAGRAAVAGFSMWTLFSLGIFVAMAIGMLVWAPRWSRLKVLTPVEYLEQRYGNSVRMLIAISGIGVKFIDLGIKLFAISIVVHVVTGWDVLPIILVSGLVTIGYVFIGGLWATVLTDLVQFVVQLAISLMVLFIAMSAVGGWQALWDALPAERSGWFNPEAGISIEFWLVYLVVIVFSYNGGTWGLAQRFISVNKPREAQKAAMLSGFLYLLYPIAIFLPAWAAPLLLPEFFDSATLQPVPGFDLDQTYILVTQKILSNLAPGLIGLLVCSMFAATMSMIDSDINSLAAVFTKDVWQRNVNRHISDAALFNVGMVTTGVLGLAVLVSAILVSLSPGMNKVFDFTVKLFGGLLPPIAIPLMFGMLWKRTTSRGAILSFVGGLLTYFIAGQYTDRFEIYTGLEILVALAIYFGEGFIASRSKEKDREVEALFEKLSPRSDRTEMPAG